MEEPTLELNYDPNKYATDPLKYFRKAKKRIIEYYKKEGYYPARVRVLKGAGTFPLAFFLEEEDIENSLKRTTL